MKKCIPLLLILLLLVSCKNYVTTKNNYDSSKEIRIIYTNIAQSEINPIVFYSSIKQKKNECLEETPNTTLVDTGNILDKNNGKYNSYIDIMNEIEYDYITLGLNDFSHGLDYLYKNINKSSCKYLLSNISCNDQDKDIFKKTSPFEVVDYDGIKIAYIGVVNPTFIEKNPEYFAINDRIVINFYNETEEVFYDTVQCSINKAIELGAEYVVLLSNLDTIRASGDDTRYYLDDLISNIQGASIVINQNNSTKNEEIFLKDINNNDVFVVSNSQSKSNIGIITINNGKVDNSYSCDYIVNPEFEKIFKDILEK